MNWPEYDDTYEEESFDWECSQAYMAACEVTGVTYKEPGDPVIRTQLDQLLRACRLPADYYDLCMLRRSMAPEDQNELLKAVGTFIDTYRPRRIRRRR